MPIRPSDIEMAKGVLVAAGATRVLVFGTADTSPETARDLDLACEGIPPERFFYVYGQLLLKVGVPVDLIDLSDDSPVARHVRKRGSVLYVRA